MGQVIAEFFAGGLFRYLLHAAQLAIAEGMCGVYSERRSHFVLRSAAVLAAYLVLAACIGALLESVLPPCSYLIAAVISFPCFMLCFRCNLWNGLLCTATAIAVQNLSNSASAMAGGIFGGASVSVWNIAVRIIIYAAVHMLCFVVSVRKFKNIRGDFGKERFIVAAVTLLLLAVVYLIQPVRQPSETLELAEFLEWRAFFICYDLLILLTLSGICDRNALRLEKDILNALRESEKKHYEVERYTVETINLKCHDLKHQIVALKNHAGGELEQPLEELENAVATYEVIAKTGCKPLDVVLTQKHFICANEGIALTYLVDGDALSFMRAVDIYSLFGNAVDNAVRAELNVADSARRFIRIDVSSRGRLLHIQIENYCEEDIVFKNGLPVTTKQDRKNHGFGMLSIKRTVERYGGAMTVSCAEKIFCLSITFPLSAP